MTLRAPTPSWTRGSRTSQHQPQPGQVIWSLVCGREELEKPPSVATQVARVSRSWVQISAPVLWERHSLLPFFHFAKWIRICAPGGSSCAS